MKKILFSLALLVFSFAAAYAQPRMIEKKIVKPDPAVYANVTYKAQYEGGMFGFTQREQGVLKFDDANFRVVFMDKNNKERFSIPYSAINTLIPNQSALQSTSGKVVGAIPLPGTGLLGGMMKEKKKYLVVNFDDTEVNARGLINFKLDNQEAVTAAIQTLGEKAEMQPRGDSYYRPQKKSQASQSSNNP